MSTTRDTVPATSFDTFVAAEVRQLMCERGFTQTSLAEKSGVKQPRISRSVFSVRSSLPVAILDELAVTMGDTASGILRRAERKYFEANEERAKIQEERAKLNEERARLDEEIAKLNEERAKLQEERAKLNEADTPRLLAL